MLLPQRKGWAKYEIDYIMHMEWCEEDGGSWCKTKTHVLAANFIFIIIIIIIIMSIPVASDDASYNFYHWVSEFFRSDSIPHKTYFRKNVDVSVVTFSVGIPTRWISTSSSQNGGMSKMFPTWNTCQKPSNFKYCQHNYTLLTLAYLWQSSSGFLHLTMVKCYNILEEQITSIVKVSELVWVGAVKWYEGKISTWLHRTIWGTGQAQLQRAGRVTGTSREWKRTIREIIPPTGLGEYYPLFPPSIAVTGQSTSDHPPWRQKQYVLPEH